ncbi:MAG: Ig-like domain-containing protein [bacterium]
MKTRVLITMLVSGILLLGFMSVSSQKIHPWVLKAIPNDSDGDGVVDTEDACNGEDASYFDRDGDGCIDDPVGMRHIEYWGDEDLPVVYVIHENGAPGITDGSDFTAIQNAIDAWPAVSGTDLTASYGGTTTDGEAAALDQVNTVTFEDTDYDFGQYVLAVGVATSFTEATDYNGKVYRPGQIVDADMIFNPNKNFKTATQGFGQDIRAVATHEAGHLFGISHSAVKSSTMFFILPFGTAATSLETEDETVFLKAYPDAATLASANRLSGKVVDGGSADPLNPDPVPGAIVFAINAAGDTLGCEYTMPDGSYEFFSLPDGSYYVSIYPLNGTSLIAGLVPGYINDWVDTTAVTVFVPEYWNTGDSTDEDPSLKDLVSVSGGASVADIDVVTNIDATAPMVLHTSPESSDTGVRIDAAMVIRFSEAVKTSSLRDNFVIREVGPNTAESGRAVIYRDDSLMSFTQDQPYKFNTTYVCSLKTGITDLFDNPLANPYVVTFTTEQEPPLNITSLVPNKGVPGSIVVINGGGFGYTAATNHVYFHDNAGVPLEAQVAHAGPNRLVITVPEGAGTGDVYVESGGETSNDLTFTILSATEIARGYEAGVSTLGGVPRALTVLPDGSYAYVATDAGFSAVGVDPGDAGYLNSVDKPVAGGLDDLDAIPTSKRVYAVSRADSSISVIGSDPAEQLLFNKVINTLDVLAEPLGIIIEPTGRRAYVPTTGGEVQIWDVQLGSATYWRQVGAFSSPDANVRSKMAIDPLSGDLLALSGTGKLLIFDLGPDTLRAEVSVGPDPRDVIIDPAGQRAYVSDGSGVVSIVALADPPYFVQDITTGGSPRGLTITPAGLWIYETNRDLDIIDVIDLNETNSTWRTVAATIDQGSDPVDVDLSPDGFYAFSVVQGPKQLVATTIGLGPVLKSLSKGAGPTGSKLVLAGSGFGWAIDNVRVNFENSSGGITSVTPEFSTASAITTTVPPDAVSGPVNMVMWLSDVANPIPQYSNALYFEVLDTTSTGALRWAADIVALGGRNYSPELKISPIGDQMALVGNGDEISFIDIDPTSPTLHQTLKTTDLTDPLHLTSIKECVYARWQETVRGRQRIRVCLRPGFQPSQQHVRRYSGAGP